MARSITSRLKTPSSAHQQRAIERAQHLGNALVVRSFKHGRHSCQGQAQGIDQLLLMRLQR